MCGIFGVVDLKPVDQERSLAALATLQHRGPDQWGQWHEPQTFIGHQRLSIMDLSEQGRQPMISNDTVIAVNGEIYNFVELRSELEPHFAFHSQSDSEVLLHGYRAWGIDKLLERIDGMYAIAIYDRPQGILYLARDHFGKKPLFYSHVGDRLIFASEVKALFEYDDSLRVFSYEGIKNWIQYRGSNRVSTIYENINRLSPGCVLRWQDGGSEVRSYYDLIDHATDGTEASADVNTVVEHLLNDSVKKRLMSDVPVGLQLSGGVDSSLIAYYLKQNQVGRLHTFSIGFSDPAHADWSEERYARHVAGEMGLEHHQINIDNGDVAAAFEQVVWLFDGMWDYPSAIANYLLDKYAKQFVTVMLVGEGADELFCGYRKYLQVEKLAHGSAFPRTMVPSGAVELMARFGRLRTARKLYLARRYGGRTHEILNDLNSYINTDTFEQLFGRSETSLFDGMPLETIEGLPLHRQLQLIDHKTYLYSLMDRQDRASMGASIEARCPFLDRQLAEYAVTLPQRVLYDGRETKLVLKQICSSIFGEEFTYRPKRGFPMPLASWLADDRCLKPYVGRIFADDNLLGQRMDLGAVQDYLDSSAFSNRLLNYGDSDHMWLIWFLMVLRAAQDVFHITDIR